MSAESGCAATHEKGPAESRRLQRFFVAGPLAAGTEVAVNELARQLALVLRMQAGDELMLFDGSGQEFRCRLLTLNRDTAVVQVLDCRASTSEPQLYVSLYQCSLKQDKFEWVLQKATELGISRFVPVISERSIVRPAAALLNKYDRWSTIVREATEQCGRARIPEIAQPVDWGTAVASRNGPGLLAWESATGVSTMAQWLQQYAASAQRLSVMIGPEGGLTDQEAQVAAAHGWQIVSLGPRILRAETAAIAAAVLTLASD